MLFMKHVYLKSFEKKVKFLNSKIEKWTCPILIKFSNLLKKRKKCVVTIMLTFAFFHFPFVTITF